METENAAGIEELSADIVSEYQQELYFCLTAKGHPLTLRTQAQRLSVVKGFTRFLKDRDYLIHDPGQAIRLPKKPRRLPKVILSAAEIKKLLAAPDMRTNGGYRNRIILEILYDTAIRRAEVAGIKLHDLDLAAGYIRITGKGDKDRVVPVKPPCVRACAKLYSDGAALFCYRHRSGLFDLKPLGTEDGSQRNMGRGQALRCALRESRRTSPPIPSGTRVPPTCLKTEPRPGTCRRCSAMSLWNPPRVYTHVTINDLKQVHAKYHPSEQL